jgi:hypothetical protein
MVGWGFELRGLCLQSRCSTFLAIPLIQVNFFFFAVLGIESRVLNMPGKHPTTVPLSYTSSPELAF